MVCLDIWGLGVMFFIDIECGFDKVVFINVVWGLGENVVQGIVNFDEYQVFKLLLSDVIFNFIFEKKCGGKVIKMIYGDEKILIRNVLILKVE